MRSISRARANFRTARATSARGSRTGTTSSRRWPIAWRPGDGSSKPVYALVETRARARQRRSSGTAEEEAAINLVIESLRPDELEELVRRAVDSLPGADRPPQPDPLEPLRARQGLRTRLRRAAVLTPCRHRFPHDEQVAHLAEHPPFERGSADMLREIGAVHRATDPALGQEPGRRQRAVAKKGVIEVAKAGGKVLLGLVGEQERDVTAGTEDGESSARRARRKASQAASGALAIPSAAYRRASMV